ncbi:MAG: glycosyltransferase family 4 protein [Fimbriimonadales bacterium]|nr:glycosyltransferase family 4 protein [Fimbriimonadales bacterium]
MERAGTRPRVAIDVRLIGRSNTGDSTYWLGLLHGLCRIRHGFDLLLFSNAPRPAGIPLPEDAAWIRLPCRSDRWWSWVAFPLEARRARASVLHTQYSLSPLAKGIGVTTIHDVSFFIEPSWFRPKDRVLLRSLVPLAARWSSRVVTVSQTSKADIERFLPAARGKVRVAPNAPHPDLRPVERCEARRLVEREFGIKEPYLLTVGTRWPRKNLSLATRAVELLPEETIHRLVLTGKPGWGPEEIGPRCRPVGYVSLPQLAALYSAADLYLAPSRYEGFGITILEAFACGCPVLCSSGGAQPEVAGSAGAVMRSWEPEDWAGAILGLLGDSSKLERMRTEGRRRAAEFSWEDAARRTCEVYQEVLS